MLKVRATRKGFIYGQRCKEGAEFELVDRTGYRWKDKNHRDKEEIVITAKQQFSDSWMELIEECEDPSDAPKIVYVDSSDKDEPNKVVKKASKESTKKAVKKPEEKTEDNKSDDKVI